jgi:hypothetical protein
MAVYGAATGADLHLLRRAWHGGISAAFRREETLWGCVPQLRVVKNHLVSL